MELLSFFPSFTFLSFTFLFNLFCFFKFTSKCRFIESPRHISESKLLIIFTERKRERETKRETERESRRSPDMRGGRVVRWCWVNFQCRGVLLIWIIVEQGPSALAVGAGGVVWTCFSRLSFLFSFSLFGRRLDMI